MGFSKSYKEVRRYEKNVALIFNDHNPANLDGRNTVHWMGMTLAISPVCPGNP